MCKGTIPRDVIVKGDGDVDCLCYNVFEITEFFEVVFAFDVFFVGCVHAGEETANRGDAVSFTDTEDGGVDVGCTSFESSVGIGDGTTCVIVEMTLNVTGYNTSKCPHKIVYLPWIRTSNLKSVFPPGEYSIGDTDTIHTNFINSAINRQEIHQI
jgi:hypothetical protein